jgi:hypothetical protein
LALSRAALIVAIAVVLMSAEQPKFTPDQCRVLRQAGVDVRGICPLPRDKKEPRKRKR